MNSNMFFWLIVAVLFALLEMASPTLFFFLSFSASALITAGLAVFVAESYIQLYMFLITTVIALVALRGWVKMHEHKRHSHKTNSAALPGKEGMVITRITATQVGEVKVFGDIWSARSEGGKDIEVGAIIKVVRVQGSHLIVTELS